MIKLNNPSIPDTRSVYSHRNSVDSYENMKSRIVHLHRVGNTNIFKYYEMK